MTPLQRRLARVDEIVRDLERVERQLHTVRSITSVLLPLAALLGAGPLLWSLHTSKRAAPLAETFTMVWFVAVVALTLSSLLEQLLRFRRAKMIARLTGDAGAPQA